MSVCLRAFCAMSVRDLRASSWADAHHIISNRRRGQTRVRTQICFRFGWLGHWKLERVFCALCVCFLCVLLVSRFMSDYKRGGQRAIVVRVFCVRPSADAHESAVELGRTRFFFCSGGTR